MADTVTSQTIQDGIRNLVMHFTNVSDGTGEAAVVKIDPATLSKNSDGRACTDLVIQAVEGTADGMAVQILWDATTPVLADLVSTGTNFRMKHYKNGGIPNPRTTGWTGKIKFTTVGATLTDSYNITLHCTKVY